MDLLNPLFSIVVFFTAFLTGYVILTRYKISDSHSERYESVEGIRGFLSISVFIHHSVIWYQYFKIGRWDFLPSVYYNMLGKVSVMLFFMITSFLFVTKLLNTPNKKFNWPGFFIGRIFRLVPVYYFSLAVMVLIVMVISKWELNVSLGQFSKTVFDWAIFAVEGQSDINNFNSTFMINAGVVWSLPYEWLFYFSLPIIAWVVLLVRPPLGYLLLSTLFIYGFAKVHRIDWDILGAFGGGILAAFLLKYPVITKQAKGVGSSMIVIACFYAIGMVAPINDSWVVILTAVIFTITALGNSMFGVLKNPVLKFLGEIGYSTYLLHGIIMFLVFYFGFGYKLMKGLSPLRYSLIILSITPFVVVVSFLGFSYIEKPFIKWSKRLIIMSDSKNKGVKATLSEDV